MRKTACEAPGPREPCSAEAISASTYTRLSPNCQGNDDSSRLANSPIAQCMHTAKSANMRARITARCVAGRTCWCGKGGTGGKRLRRTWLDHDCDCRGAIAAALARRSQGELIRTDRAWVCRLGRRSRWYSSVRCRHLLALCSLHGYTHRSHAGLQGLCLAKPSSVHARLGGHRGPEVRLSCGTVFSEKHFRSSFLASVYCFGSSPVLLGVSSIDSS